MYALIALLSVTAAVPPASPIEGRWTNPKQSLVVRISRCGSNYCGIIEAAHDRPGAKGSSASLVGTQVLGGFRRAANGSFTGKAFDPRHGVASNAVIRVTSPNSLAIKGCVVGGLLCKEQHWRRVGQIERNQRGNAV